MLRIQDPPEESKQEEVRMTLDGLAQEGARQLLMTALEEEVSDYIERHVQERDEKGHALVVRNGRAQARKLTMGCGTMELEAPRVNDKREVEGERQRFTSGILPPYMRRSPKVSEVLPLLYLRGLSTNDFRPALKELLGEDASGLSPTAITRLTGKWQSEYDEFHKRDLSKDTFAYIWIDGIHFNVRLEDDRLCTLVVLGVRADGTKVLLAVEDGYRESEESWAYVLRDLERRGLEVPLLAIGDGRIGVLGRGSKRVAGDAPPVMLGAQIEERPRQVAEASPQPREERSERDHES